MKSGNIDLCTIFLLKLLIFELFFIFLFKKMIWMSKWNLICQEFTNIKKYVSYFW